MTVTGLPAMYIVEFTADAVQSIIQGDHGISKIVLASETAKHDLDAFANLQIAINSLRSEFPLAEERIVYNPDFFPTLTATEVTPDMLAEKMEAEERLENDRDEYLASGKVATVITKFFDPVGDFVIARWTLDSQDSHIVGRVAADVDHYACEKNKQNQCAKTTFIDYRDIRTTHVH